MVGTARFELATSRTPSVRATRLRHVPSNPFQYLLKTLFVKQWMIRKRKVVCVLSRLIAITNDEPRSDTELGQTTRKIGDL